MTQVQISRFGGPQVLQEVEVPSRPLTPDEVRIKVSAAGVNFAEVHMRVGLNAGTPRPPFVPGFEVAGVITEVGADVRSFRRGERVLALCRFGGYASEVALSAQQVRKTPRRLSDREAAAIPVAFATAWIALVDLARVREGDRVLVPGAAGGVGTAIVQVAARAGAHVIATVGSPDKKEKVRALGAARVYTYEEMNRKAGGDREGYDIVLEARGGAHVKEAMRRLAPGGRVVCYGVSSLISGARRSIPHALRGMIQTAVLTPIGLAMVNKGVMGLNMLTLMDSEPGRRLLNNALDRSLEAVQSGLFKPIVAKAFPLARAAEAHEFIQSRKAIGKVVLTC